MNILDYQFNYYYGNDEKVYFVKIDFITDETGEGSESFFEWELEEYISKLQNILKEFK